MNQIVNNLIRDDISPEEVSKIINWRGDLFISFNGSLDEKSFAEQLMELDTGGKLPKTKRYFCKQDELFVIDNKTYALTNQWGLRTEEAANLLCSKYPKMKIHIARE